MRRKECTCGKTDFLFFAFYAETERLLASLSGMMNECINRLPGAEQ